jgi:hypothetical protein
MIRKSRTRKELLFQIVALYTSMAYFFKNAALIILFPTH